MQSAFGSMSRLFSTGVADTRPGCVTCCVTDDYGDRLLLLASTSQLDNYVANLRITEASTAPAAYAGFRLMNDRIAEEQAVQVTSTS